MTGCLRTCAGKTRKQVLPPTKATGPKHTTYAVSMSIMAYGKGKVNESKYTEESKKAFADAGIMILRSDNIRPGEKIPMPDHSVGIVVEETEVPEK